MEQLEGLKATKSTVLKVLQTAWKFRRIFRVIRRSKLSQIHVFESLSKPLKFREILRIDSYLFHLSEKMKVFRRVWFKKTNVLESLPKPRKISEEFKSRNLFSFPKKWVQLTYGYVEPSEGHWPKATFFKVNQIRY